MRLKKKIDDQKNIFFFKKSTKFKNKMFGLLIESIGK